MLDPVDPHKDFVEMPLPLRMFAQTSRSFRPDLVCEYRTKPVDPEADTLMTDVYPALMEQVFDVAERERETDIHHHGQLDYFAGCFEIPERVAGHAQTLAHHLKRTFP
jgi:hypothetical protein